MALENQTPLGPVLDFFKDILSSSKGRDKACSLFEPIEPCGLVLTFVLCSYVRSFKITASTFP